MQPHYRVATAQEIAYYTQRLYPIQDRILELAGSYDDALVLTGGTGLARCYLDHRFSDDIDLFTAQPQAGRLGRDFANALERADLRVEPVNAGPDFFRAIVSDGVTRVQLDIAPDSPRILVPERSRLGVFVHALRDIAANKISAYENRTEVKDAVDLYHLAQHLRWEQMFADAERKRVPIAYEDLQHFLEQPLSGEALLREPIGDVEFERFVATLHDEIAREIKKKIMESEHLIPTIVTDLLWDTPLESRTINPRTRPVLERRAGELPLPQRIALRRALAS
jgi:hypothetical protein